MPLQGIKINNYRSFNAEGITLENFGKVNLFIGKNNSGKSNVLRFINKLPKLFEINYKLDQMDCHNFDAQNIPWFSIYHTKESLVNILSIEALNIIFDKVDTLRIQYELSESPSYYTLSFEHNEWLEKTFNNT